MPRKMLNRKAIMAALEYLNQLCGENEIMLEVSIYGGTAMMLAYDSRNATWDVDAIFHPVEEGQRLVTRVARDLGLHDQWMNNDVKMFVADRESKRQLTEFSAWSHLKISVPVSAYLLAMKAIACRDALPGFEGDQGDLRFLIKKMNIKSVAEIQEVIDKYFENEVLGSNNVRVLNKLIQEVHESIK